jgi:hypothetical protein
MVERPKGILTRTKGLSRPCSASGTRQVNSPRTGRPTATAAYWGAEEVAHGATSAREVEWGK